MGEGLNIWFLKVSKFPETWLHCTWSPGAFSTLIISSVQSLSLVWLLATPWTAVCQASLSITNSQNSLNLMSTESVMPSYHLILCCPLLLLPSIFPSIGVFSNDPIFLLASIWVACCAFLSKSSQLVILGRSPLAVSQQSSSCISGSLHTQFSLPYFAESIACVSPRDPPLPAASLTHLELDTMVPLLWPLWYHAVTIFCVWLWTLQRQGHSIHLLTLIPGTLKRLSTFSLQDWKSKKSTHNLACSFFGLAFKTLYNPTPTILSSLFLTVEAIL